jgi:hypothetical protein
VSVSVSVSVGTGKRVGVSACRRVGVSAGTRRFALQSCSCSSSVFDRGRPASPVPLTLALTLTLLDDTAQWHAWSSASSHLNIGVVAGSRPSLAVSSAYHSLVSGSGEKYGFLASMESEKALISSGVLGVP